MCDQKSVFNVNPIIDISFCCCWDYIKLRVKGIAARYWHSDSNTLISLIDDGLIRRVMIVTHFSVWSSYICLSAHVVTVPDLDLLDG